MDFVGNWLVKAYSSERIEEFQSEEVNVPGEFQKAPRN
jgi:hypothetical protein